MIALGLGADSGIFLQPLWQADELQYLVINDRDEAVDILANADLAGCNGELVSERLAGPWTLEARSHRVLSGSEVTALFGQYSSWFANGSPLGVDHLGERPPLAAEAGMVISNHGMNGGGGDSFAQIETDFVVAPGPTFTITIVLPPGDLTLAARPFEVGLRTVDVLAVRSERATVRETADGFSVVVAVPGNPAWSYASATADDFARIEVDVAVPSDIGDAPGVAFDAWFCAIRTSRGECAAGNGMSRAFALSR